MGDGIGPAELVHCPELEGYYLIYKSGQKDFFPYQFGEVCESVEPRGVFEHPVYGPSYYVIPNDDKPWEALPANDH